MTLQNRVDPFGAIVADPARGTMMGNRGRLHDAARHIGGRRWATKAWICCRLAFRGRQRQVMAPGSYTELFFLDEATAFAAGHRPCYECRRADYNQFLGAWSRGHGGDRASLRAGAIDARLHAERVERGVHEARPGDLPDGTFVTLSDDPAAAWLLWRGALRRWSFTGYGPPVAVPTATVRVVTPSSTVAALASGYRPGVHPSTRAAR